MARPLRLEFPGAVYHVTSRGNARNDIYLDDQDRQDFLNILADTIERYNWLCHAYCLMDNHYHLLIETLDPNLSLGMRQLNGVYTQTFNRNHHRVGHVFQGRFKAILVEKDLHLLELGRYIVLNPVAAGITVDPKSWRWSSYSSTAGLSGKPSFLTVAWVLSQFARQPKKARSRYIQFVKDGLGKNVESPWQKLKGQIFFGGDAFMARMQSHLSERQAIGEIPREQRYPNRPSLTEIFRDTPDKTSRNLKIREAHREYGYTLQEIARSLGIHYSTVSRAANKSE